MFRLRMAVTATALACSFAFAQSANQAVVRHDPALDALVSSDARVELVKSGFGFTEGPVWVQQGRQGYLLFTDMPGNVVWKMAADGNASVYLEHVGYNGPEVWRWRGIQNNGYDKADPRYEEFAMIGADGLTLDRQGRLILATFAGRSLMRIENNGKRTILADRWEGKRFGGPNDVVVKSDGVCGDFDMGVRYSSRKRHPSLRNYGRKVSNSAFHVRRSGAGRFRFRDHRTNPRQSRTPTPGTFLTVGTDVDVHDHFAFLCRAPEQSGCP
jgi:hypothetical protein